MRFERLDVLAGLGPGRQRLENLATVEARVVLGELGAQLQCRGACRVVRPWCRSAQRLDVGEVEPERDGAKGPVDEERGRLHGVLLRSPRAHGRPPRRARRRAGCYGRLDLGSALGELAEDRRRYCVKLRGALQHRAPADTPARGQTCSQLGLVQESGGAGVGVEVAGIECRPGTVRTLRRVRHNDVRVQLRITGPTRSVPKRRADEAAALEAVGAVVAPADEHRLALQVAQRRRQRLLVRGDDLTADLGSAQRPRHRHRLRRGEGQIQRGDPPVRSAERAPISSAPPAQERDEVVVGDRAIQAEALGAPASPVPRDLGAADVVVLGAVRDRAQVVALLTRRELPDRQHTPTKPRSTDR